MAIATWESERRGVEIAIDSAGTLGIVGEPADSKAATVAMELGLDLHEHRSKALTAEHLQWADRILVMTDEHLRYVGTLAPDAVDRVVPLGRLVGLDEIDDPHGRWFLAPYRRCREDLRRAVDKMLASHASRPIPT